MGHGLMALLLLTQLMVRKNLQPQPQVRHSKCDESCKHDLWFQMAVNPFLPREVKCFV